LAEIGLNGGKAAAQRLNLFGRFCGILRLTPTISHPACARPSVIPAQAGITTGHDGDLTRQVEGVQYHMHLCMLRRV
jgi:hypothetical protein